MRKKNAKNVRGSCKTWVTPYWVRCGKPKEINASSSKFHEKRPEIKNLNPNHFWISALLSSRH